MVKIYGRMRSAEGYAIRDFLHRCDIPFEWIELNRDVPVDYWNGNIEYTEDAIGALKPLPAR